MNFMLHLIFINHQLNLGNIISRKGSCFFNAVTYNFVFLLNIKLKYVK
jgi:hypothetical protein